MSLLDFFSPITIPLIATIWVALFMLFLLTMVTVGEGWGWWRK